MYSNYLVFYFVTLLLCGCNFSNGSNKNLEKNEKGILNTEIKIKKQLDICIIDSHIIFDDEEISTENLNKELKNFFNSSADNDNSFSILVFYDEINSSFEKYTELIKLIENCHEEYLNKVSIQKFNDTFDNLSKTNRVKLGNKLILSELSSGEFDLVSESLRRVPKCKPE